MKVSAQALQRGDKIGSGEIISEVYETVMTPLGKINVVLKGQAKDKNGQVLGSYERRATWNKNTKINVERA